MESDVYVAVRMSKRRCPGVTARGRGIRMRPRRRMVFNSSSVSGWMGGGGESSSSSESSLESSTSGGGVSPGVLGFEEYVCGVVDRW